MKVAIYPGSFNPWHKGHTDVLLKALQVFDKVIVAIGVNPEKEGHKGNASRTDVMGHLLDVARINILRHNERLIINAKEVKVVVYNNLLKDFIKDYKHRDVVRDTVTRYKISAIIKGIRDPQDFLYEQKMQYHNEDLGITIPTYYVIAKRDLVHISSSAIRGLEKFKKG